MTFAQRVAGVLRLQPAAFEDVESDRRAIRQAIAVVIVASVGPGLAPGTFMGAAALLTETVAGLVGWFMWAAVAYVIGARLLPESETRTSFGELLRVIGFAFAPNVFAFLGFVPRVGTTIRELVAFWLLAATIIAVRQALDYRSTLRAAVVVVAGWLLFEFIQRSASPSL